MSKCIICGGPLDRHYPGDMHNVCINHSYSLARQAADEAALKPQEAVQDYASLIAAARAAVQAWKNLRDYQDPPARWSRWDKLNLSMQTLANELTKV